MHLLLFNIFDTIRSLGWTGALNVLRDGIVLGALYSLVALGYTLVYGILKLLNFAHGDVFMVGAFMGFGVLSVIAGPASSALSLVPLIIVSFAVAMLGSGVLGVVIERVATGRCATRHDSRRSSARSASCSSSRAASALITDGQHSEYNELRGFRAAVPAAGVQHRVDPDQRRRHPHRRDGYRADAGADVPRQPDPARQGDARHGIRPGGRLDDGNRHRSRDLRDVLHRSALAGAAGVMYGLRLSDTYYLVGFAYGLKAFTAAVVGGIGSMRGAMLGGVIVGLAEEAAGVYAGRAVEGPRRLRDPDPLSARPADRPLRLPRHPEGMSEPPDTPDTPELPPAAGEPAPQTSRIGVDSWVAESEARRSRTPAAVFARGWEKTPDAVKLLASSSASPRASRSGQARPTCSSSVCSRSSTQRSRWASTSSSVCRPARPRYVAFYGIGAYTYAELSSPQYGIHWPRGDDPARHGGACARRALPRFRVAPAARRLLRDRHALPPRGLRLLHERDEPDRGRQGIHRWPGRLPERRSDPLLRLQADVDRRQQYFLLLGVVALLRRRSISSTSHAQGARGARSGRIRSLPRS